MEILNKNGMILMDYRREFKRHYADSVDEALKDAKEEGKEEAKQELIRQFSKIITPEEIADTLQVSLDYVLDVLKD